MELLESPKLAYLLEASLEVLHFESNEWLSEIAFRKDETAFFQKILEKKATKATSYEDKLELEHLQNKIIHYRFEVLEDLKNSVLVHEKYLANIIDYQVMDNDQIYREKHKAISDQMAGFEKEYKIIKKELFRFAEELL